ncbi:MAG: Chemotaxis response regulator protein-glutamate methylesterase [Candidatus Magnetoglobus multicellularis str. Araruama]|uniref:protein-glutamate methylesterase n=1 Tax=Candidatus Magnetoglobus multicellularis str. Araruama TaxID=890399 RepID=A0A1V1PCD1_9BACT|nr:MAG: Chemotaxis response regulator protein-glutamate methylesterase [Candidatus Magnetoglobus multicellularis str. Araruama]
MIRVLIVDDSLTLREYLKELLIMDGRFQVVGEARDGFEALNKVKTTKPDVVTMDIQMPGMDGYEATRRIMEEHPVPIVIVSAAWIPQEVESTFKAMKVGAVAGVRKPEGIISKSFKSDVRDMLNTIKLMSEVKVIRRRSKQDKNTESPAILSKTERQFNKSNYELLAIGASTGGPPVLQNILSKLSSGLSVPIVVVQHITCGFINGLADWLDKTTPFNVQIASENQQLLAGHVYFAPDSKHMGVRSNKTVFLAMIHRNIAFDHQFHFCFDLYAALLATKP